MKALSLWQPWAHAIVTGGKRIETRSWATKYRGPLIIHAAKRKITQDEMVLLSRQGCWQAVFGQCEIGHPRLPVEKASFGAIVATCYLSDCIPTLGG